MRIYLSLFWTFFKIGAFTFGGGYAMLPMIQEEVIKHNWAEMSDLVNFIAISESTPGPFAVNVATFVGSSVGGILGAFCSTIGVVLPSFLIIIIVAHFFEKFKNNRYWKYAMDGLKPSVVGLIGAAFISVSISIFFSNGLSSISVETIVPLLIFMSMCVLSYKKVHPIFVILISAGCGIAGGYILGI